MGWVFGGGTRLLAVLFHHGQAVLVARQRIFKRVAQIDQQMIAISNFLGTWGAAFGSLCIHTGPVESHEFDSGVLA